MFFVLVSKRRIKVLKVFKKHGKKIVSLPKTVDKREKNKAGAFPNPEGV